MGPVGSAEQGGLRLTLVILDAAIHGDLFLFPKRFLGIFFFLHTRE